MAATTAMTVTEAVSALAAMCKRGEAALTMITTDEGLSWCITSETTAHSVARSIAAEPDQNLLAVAVISADGKVTEYYQQ